jgi:hypothetical protein
MYIIINNKMAMNNCIKGISQIECERKDEKITKLRIQKGLKALKKNIKNKKYPDNLILIEWDINYDFVCTCLGAIVRYFINKNKGFHCLPIIYDNGKYYFIHDIVELNELLDDYYHITLEIIHYHKSQLKIIEDYEKFKNEICNEYKNVITCTPKYYKIPKLMNIKYIIKNDFDLVCNVK